MKNEKNKGTWVIFGNGTSLIKNLPEAFKSALSAEHVAVCNHAYMYAPLLPNLKYVAFCDRDAALDFWNANDLKCVTEKKFFTKLMKKGIFHERCKPTISDNVFLTQDHKNTGLHLIRQAYEEGAAKIICFGFDNTAADTWGQWTMEQVECKNSEFANDKTISTAILNKILTFIH